METIVGVFYDRSDAEEAVEEIRNRGYTEDEISIVAREDTLQDDVETDDDDGSSMFDHDLTTGTSTGGALGGLAGLLVGAGALAIPGIGPILAVGPIAAGLTGVVAGGLVGGLVDLGIPQDRSERLEDEVRQGGILAIIEAEDEESEEISDTLRDFGAKDVEIH